MLYQRGVILVTILIFLFVFALLAISGLVNGQLQLQMSHHLREDMLEFQATEAGLREGEAQLVEQQPIHCYSSTPLNQLPWTSDQACTLSEGRFIVRYVIEQLANQGNICAVTVNERNNGFILQKAIFYRITAWTEQSNGYPSILQSTFAGTADAVCDQESGKVKVGRLSWRQLS